MQESGKTHSYFQICLGFKQGGSSNDGMTRITVTLTRNVNGNSVSTVGWMPYTGNGTFTTTYPSGFVSAAKHSRTTDDRGENITIYETKLIKSAIKTQFGVDDLTDAYYFFIHRPTLAPGNGTTYGEFRYQVQMAGHNAPFVSAYGWCPTFFPHLMKFRAEDIYTENGAAVRLKAETGLRFYTSVSKAFWDSLLLEHGEENVSFGTLITPASYVAEAGVFTKEALDSLVKDSAKYLDVKTNKAFAEDDEIYTFVGSVTDIKVKNFTLDYAAIGYIQAGDEIYYSTNYTVRNIEFVATSALSDTSTAQSADYPYETETAGVFSPYTAEQRIIIAAFIKEVD